MFCVGVYVYMCVCVLFANGKLVSDFKHSKSFRGTFITSRVSTVLQLVLVSLCFMASAYSYSVHYPFGTNRCTSNLVRPICYLFCCWCFFQLLVKLFGTLSLSISTVLSLFCQFYEVVVSTRFICFPACALILIVWIPKYLFCYTFLLAGTHKMIFARLFQNL